VRSAREPRGGGGVDKGEGMDHQLFYRHLSTSERSGMLLSKKEFIARVWPSAFVAERNFKIKSPR